MEAVAAGTLIGGKLAMAGAVLGAASSIFQGFTARSAASAQARQLEVQRKAEETQAAIEAEQRQMDLRRVLAAQTAIFGTAGVGLSSGTPLTIAQDSVNNATRQQNQGAMFSSVRRGVMDMQIADTRAAGNFAMARGFLGATTSLIDFGVRQSQIGVIPKAGGY